MKVEARFYYKDDDGCGGLRRSLGWSPALASIVEQENTKKNRRGRHEDDDHGYFAPGHEKTVNDGLGNVERRFSEDEPTFSTDKVRSTVASEGPWSVHLR